MRSTHLLIAMAVLVVLAASAMAGDAITPSAMLPADGSIPAAGDAALKARLARALAPLTVGSLENEVSGKDGWHQKFSDKGEEVSRAFATGAENADDLFEQQKALGQWLVLVLDAWEDRVGDDADAKAKIAAIRGDVNAVTAKPTGPGISMADAKDPSALMNKLWTWLKDPDGGIAIGLKIAAFIVILVLFRILAAVLAGVTRKATMKMKKVSNLLRDFFVNTVRKLTFFIGLVVALGQLGINIGPFVAAIGAVGFIIAFALQGTLSNFAAGIMILLYRPYDIGDVATVSGVTGKVCAMSLVSTTLKTPDNQVVIVPNGSIWGDVITNITGEATRRVDMVFGIGYGDDIPKAQALLEKILDEHELTLADPAPVVQVHELADSSVNFVCRPWAKTSDYWQVYWDITRSVKMRFDEEGISIPFPQQDVHMHQVAAE